MLRHLHSKLIAVAALALTLAATPAFAGDADFEGGDDHDDGVPFFGEAKDVTGLKGMDGVRVRAEVKGGSFPVIISTDSEGKFKFRGFGKDVNPDNVTITCSREGFGLVDVSRRRVSAAKEAPVEIECLLEAKM